MTEANEQNEELSAEGFAALFDDGRPAYTVGFLGARIDADSLKLGHPAIVDARLEEIERNIIEIKALLAL